MAKRTVDVEKIREAAGRAVKHPRPRRPIKFEHRDGTNYVSERLVDPERCEPKSYRAVGETAPRAHVPPGVVITTCCPRGQRRVNGRCTEGSGFAQRILHHVERFKVRHPDEWARLMAKKPDSAGMRVLWFAEIADLPRYEKVREEKREVAGLEDFGAMFDMDFQTRGQMMKYLAESGWLQEQVENVQRERAAKRAQKAERRAMAAQQAMLRSVRQVEREGMTGATSMDFEDNEAMRAWLAIIAPKGYGTSFMSPDLESFGSMWT